LKFTPKLRGYFLNSHPLHCITNLATTTNNNNNTAAATTTNTAAAATVAAPINRTAEFI
jgi:hypothetical protein